MTFALQILLKLVVVFFDGTTVETATGLLRTLTLELKRAVLMWAQSLNQLCDPGHDTEPL